MLFSSIGRALVFKLNVAGSIPVKVNYGPPDFHPSLNPAKNREVTGRAYMQMKLSNRLRKPGK